MTSSSAFEVQEGPHRGWARLLVGRELDTSTALTFRRRVRALKATHTHVCIDLSQLEFIDPAGAHALQDVLADARHGSWRVEVAPNASWQATRYFGSITTTGPPTES